MKRPIALGVCALAAIVAAAAFAVAGGWWAPWAARYVQGVDVSWHQGAIDWRALASDNVRFAYIKASEGADYADPRFAFNWREAGRSGLYRGAYHYFTLCRSGSAQAAQFIAIVPNESGALPPAVDLEHKGPCRRGPTMTNVDGEVRVFLDSVEAHYGVRPILYVTREFHDAHLAEWRGERFWVRSLFAAPAFRQNDWLIWQHHNRGHKSGVSGPIDLDAWRGDETTLAQFAVSGERS